MVMIYLSNRQPNALIVFHTQDPDGDSIVEITRLELDMKIIFYHRHNIKVLQSITLDSCDEKHYNRAIKYI